MEISPTLKFVLEGLGSLGIAGITFKYVISGIAEYIKATYHAATNCLPTIQKNTQLTNELLVEIKESHAELVGYLKAKAEDGKF